MLKEIRGVTGNLERKYFLSGTILEIFVLYIMDAPPPRHGTQKTHSQESSKKNIHPEKPNILNLKKWRFIRWVPVTSSNWSCGAPRSWAISPQFSTIYKGPMSLHLVHDRLHEVFSPRVRKRGCTVLRNNHLGGRLQGAIKNYEPTKTSCLSLRKRKQPNRNTHPYCSRWN